MKRKMMEVEVWEASDGSIFFDEDKCSAYEEKISWEKRLNESEEFINGSLSGIRDAKELKSFLLRNKDWIQNMMAWKDEKGSSF